MFVNYTRAEPATGWVGLSEITLLPDGGFAIVERDNQLVPSAVTKKVYGVDLADADFRAYGEELVTVDKTLLADRLDELAANSIWTLDKLEGFAVAADARWYAVTDNDGLDDAIDETVFLRLGPRRRALAYPGRAAGHAPRTPQWWAVRGVAASRGRTDRHRRARRIPSIACAEQ